MASLYGEDDQLIGFLGYPYVRTKPYDFKVNHQTCVWDFGGLENPCRPSLVMICPLINLPTTVVSTFQAGG